VADPKSPASEDKGFKVVDRRRVSAEAPAPPEPPVSPQVSDDQVLGPIDFQTFLVSLASSALIHLGETPHPDTGAHEVSLPHAQQTIDLLALLQEKTKGNLTDEEGKLLQALLRDLRLRFVGATGSATKK
jgi:Domain of unknown function (DUF1844)